MRGGAVDDAVPLAGEVLQTSHSGIFEADSR
jgi:hypothetical protein